MNNSQNSTFLTGIKTSYTMLFLFSIFHSLQIIMLWNWRIIVAIQMERRQMIRRKWCLRQLNKTHHHHIHIWFTIHCKYVINIYKPLNQLWHAPILAETNVSNTVDWHLTCRAIALWRSGWHSDIVSLTSLRDSHFCHSWVLRLLVDQIRSSDAILWYLDVWLWICCKQPTDCLKFSRLGYWAIHNKYPIS